MRIEDARIIIEMIDKENYKYSDWEKVFIKSILSMKVNLSVKQSVCLQNIYSKASGGGFYQRREYC